MDGWVELLRPVDIGVGLVAPCPSHAVAPATAALLVRTVSSPCAASGEAGAVALPPGNDIIAAALETAACQLLAAADELLDTTGPATRLSVAVLAIEPACSLPATLLPPVVLAWDIASTVELDTEPVVIL